MKRYIRATGTLTQPINEVLENYVYQCYDNYNGDGLTLKDVAQIVHEHLEYVEEDCEDIIEDHPEVLDWVNANNSVEAIMEAIESIYDKYDWD